MLISSKKITAYIDFLKNSGYTVTLHGKMVNNSDFLEYNYHQNPYCHYIKTVYGKWSECIKRQYKIIEKCKDGSYFGCCYAGVGEFVYPVRSGEKIVGFVSVSGYISEISKAKAEHFALKNSISPSEISKLADRHLNKSLPEKAVVDSAIDPLVFMLEQYYEGSCDESGSNTQLYHQMLRYITENCHNKITMSDLSRKFHYSVSTLSHLFMKKSGKSLPEYVDDLRLGEAKWYLANSESSVAEIAQFLGYSSSNYFSAVFKKKCGITPKKYRASCHSSI